MERIIADFACIHDTIAAWYALTNRFSCAVGCAFPFGGNGQAIEFAAIARGSVAIVAFFVAIDDAITAIRGFGAAGCTTAIIAQTAHRIAMAVDEFGFTAGIE